MGLTHGNHYVDRSFSYNPGEDPYQNHEIRLKITTAGFVPVYGHQGYDISYGLSEGRDLVGSFSHFTGPYGPFGFWANLYHDRK